MKKQRPTIDSIEAEPIGIVISRGENAQPDPFFSAYIWAPAPEASPESKSKIKAA